MTLRIIYLESTDGVRYSFWLLVNDLGEILDDAQDLDGELIPELFQSRDAEPRDLRPD